MEGDAIASAVYAFGATSGTARGIAFENQTQYIRTGSTCQLRQYKKCCPFLFTSGISGLSAKLTGGHFMQRQRKVTICALVQLALGLNVVLVVPSVTPLAIAHITASP